MVLDDNPTIGRAVQKNLTPDRFSVELATQVAPVLARLREGRADWHVFILDVNLKDDTMNGIEVLYRLRRMCTTTSVVMLTGYDSARVARDCLTAGAFDFLTKPVRITELQAVVNRAANASMLLAGATASNSEALVEELPDPVPSLIGSSPVMQQLRRKIWQVGASNASILIQGETGTGKELVAHAVHQQSARRDRKFVPLNCGALADGLIDSALFGHVRGSFTGAVDDHPGAFVEADGGTLFLDEIGDMPSASQVRLLRAVQELEVRPLGATSVTRVDVRLISATNVDLQQAVADDKFRQDLLYRVNVVPLHVPALRDRIEDIPELVVHFLHKHRRAGRTGSPRPQLDRAALELLLSYSWPGNVRQLENTIQCALALCEGDVIMPSHLPSEIVSTPQHSLAAMAAFAGDGEGDAGDGEGDDNFLAMPLPPVDFAPDAPEREAEADSALATEDDDASSSMIGDAEVRRGNSRLHDALDLGDKPLPPMAEAMRRVQTYGRHSYLDRLLRMTSGNLTRAAKIAGVDRANFKRVLRAQGIDPAKYRPKKKKS
jgi:two-component system, NtrC family, response regulator HydG